MKLVRLVMTLTPYGVFALMTKVVASSNVADILNLGGFLVASYLGLAIMFVVHAIILTMTGVSPLKFFKKVAPVLTFAFTSRSSAASIPLSIETQTRRLGVPESIASFSASLVLPLVKMAVRVCILQCWQLWLHLQWVLTP